MPNCFSIQNKCEAEAKQSWKECGVSFESWMHFMPADGTRIRRRNMYQHCRCPKSTIQFHCGIKTSLSMIAFVRQMATKWRVVYRRYLIAWCSVVIAATAIYFLLHIPVTKISPSPVVRAMVHSSLQRPQEYVEVYIAIAAFFTLNILCSIKRILWQHIFTPFAVFTYNKL